MGEQNDSSHLLGKEGGAFIQRDGRKNEGRRNEEQGREVEKISMLRDAASAKMATTRE